MALMRNPGVVPQNIPRNSRPDRRWLRGSLIVLVLVADAAAAAVAASGGASYRQGRA